MEFYSSLDVSLAGRIGRGGGWGRGEGQTGNVRHILVMGTPLSVLILSRGRSVDIL